MGDFAGSSSWLHLGAWMLYCLWDVNWFKVKTYPQIPKREGFKCRIFFYKVLTPKSGCLLMLQWVAAIVLWDTILGCTWVCSGHDAEYCWRSPGWKSSDIMMFFIIVKFLIVVLYSRDGKIWWYPVLIRQWVLEEECNNQCLQASDVL